MRLLISSDFHLSPILTYQCLSMLEGVDAFIYLGDYCNLAGMDANWYGGCNLKGIHEIRLLFNFMRTIKIPSIYVAGNHDPEANYMPWKFPNWRVLHRPTKLTWYGVDIQVYPTGHYPHMHPLTKTYTITNIDLLLSHEPIRDYTHYYSPKLYLHGHVHTWGGYMREGYLNAACGNYIVEL